MVWVVGVGNYTRGATAFNAGVVGLRCRLARTGGRGVAVRARNWKTQCGLACLAAISGGPNRVPKQHSATVVRVRISPLLRRAQLTQSAQSRMR